MARIVTITQPADTVRCGPDGRAEYVFTIHNISDAALRVGAQIQVDEPTQKSWLNIQGPSERDLGENASEQITVQAQVPPDTDPGKYKFRLLVYSVRRPGEDYTEGETVALEVPPKEKKPEPAPPPRKFPWWIPAAVVAVLLIGGIIGWLLWPKGIEVPSVVGKPLAEARTILQDAGLEIATPIDRQQTDELSPDMVLNQDPEAGTLTEQDKAIHLTVAEKPAPQPVQVPALVGQRLAAALKKINDSGLSLGRLTEKVDRNKTEGTVLSQNPSGRERVEKGTAISLVVAKKPTGPIVWNPSDIKVMQELAKENKSMEKALINKLQIPAHVIRGVPEQPEERPEQPDE